MSVAMMQRVMREGSPRKDESSRWAPAMSTSRWDTAVLLGAVLALVVAAWPRAISTDVVLVSNSPRFVDAKALAARYGDYDQEVPASVLDAVFEYERRNNPDLVRGDNSTRNEIPVQELCDAKTGDPKLVRAVFQRPGEPDVCGPDGTGLGRQTYYERALLKRQIGAETPLSPEQLTFDLARMEQSEYRRYRGCVRNVGSFAAADVRVNPSPGYLPAPGYPGEPFTLKPGEESVRDFVTQTGYLNAQPPATLATVDTSKQAVPTDSRRGN